jgi:molybdenum cofactor cytidylyltransferase
MFSAIILAAGESKRFSSPKQLFKINNKTLIEHAVAAFTDADEIIVVLGANRELITPILPKNIAVAVNENYKSGQTSSLLCGLKKVSPNTQGVFVLPVDCALVKPQTVKKLIEEFNKHNPLIAIPLFNGHKGHPPLYSNRIIKDMLALKNDEPLYTINRKYEKDILLVDVNDENVLKNINTLEDITNCDTQ